MMGDEATKWFLRHHFRNHGLTVLRYFLKRGFMETLVKAYNICVTMVAQGHRHQLSIPLIVQHLMTIIVTNQPINVTTFGASDCYFSKESIKSI